MSRTLVLTESQYNNLLKRVDEEQFIVEDYAADLQKRMQAGAKQAQINKTKCPSGYRQLTQQQISSYTGIVKPWQDTKRGDKAYIQLPNGAVCQSFRSEKFNGIDIDALMEALRNGLTSVSGIAIQVILDFFAIGAIVNTGIWSLLSIYDIHKGVHRNQWNWFNIIVDLIGVVTTGPGGAVAKRMLSGLKSVATGSLKVFLQTMKKTSPKAFSYVYKMLKNVTSWLGKISGPLLQMISKVAAKSKGSSLYKSLITLKNGLSSIHKVIHEVEGNLILVGAKTVEKFSEKYAEHQVVHSGVGKLTGHGHGGGHGTPHGKQITQSKNTPKTTIPRYITVNGIKKPNPKFKQAYGYA
jgi:hypothetical protein